ncbi:hypothetical protein Y1Q_0017426 [Alligator mississippiensis]|uniref:EGF-like domain-containing protein n=1 Tax=Alligator mississippiensis TaxID=8496 RepID=A0A151P5R9_ALLMI|nr:hypothetical protein Y1Q_0017426 [Alligator mississippiensis]
MLGPVCAGWSRVGESLAGFLLSVNATANLSRLRIPYPQTGSWYLSLRSLCTTDRGLEPCANATAEVYLRTYLSPCINDCGTYGQCKLLRTNNYLYAACECKAGETVPPAPCSTRDPVHLGPPAAL